MTPQLSIKHRLVINTIGIALVVAACISAWLLLRLWIQDNRTYEIAYCAATPQWSPDGETILFIQTEAGSWDSELAELNLATRQTGVVATSELCCREDLGNHAWSPSGDYFAYVDFDVNKLCIAPEPGCIATGFRPRWSPNGQQIAFEVFGAQEEAKGIFLLNIDKPNVQEFLVEGASVSWSPDGSRIVYSDYSSELYVISLSTRESLHLTSGQFPQWSPNGQYIAFSRERHIYVIEPNGQAETEIGPGQNPTWSPDGETIAYTSNGIITLSRRSGERSQFPQMMSYSGTLSWSPDSDQLAFDGLPIFNDDEQLWRDHCPDLYVLNPNNEQVERLTFYNN